MTVGLKQGDILSIVLFNQHINVIPSALDDTNHGAGRKCPPMLAKSPLNSLRFANDLAIFSL